VKRIHLCLLQDNHMQSSHYLYWWLQKHHPWRDPVLAAMAAVRWLRMVPWQTPLLLLSAPGIDTGNRYESIWLTNRFWLSKTPTLSLEETFDKSDKEPKLLPWELICHCRQYINYPLQLPMHQLLISNKHQFQGTHKLPKQKNAGLFKNPTKLQLGCSLDN
jgi:hypothetical protein